MGILGPSMIKPPWWSDANRYYSRISTFRHASPQVWVLPEGGEVTSESPGSLRLHLRVSAEGMRVLDGVGQERGQIAATVPYFSYTMHRDGSLIWKLSARSVVLRRHAAQFASVDRWLFHTPWYWWLNIVGLQNGAVRVVGWVGPSKRLWGLCVDPKYDSLDLLALLALMHRNWFHS
jgi:hypothetical protein